MKFRFVLVILCLFLFSLPAFAQETIEWGDYGLEIDVPDGYDIDDSGDNGLVSIFNADAGLGIIFYYPEEDTEDFEETAEIILEDEGFEDFGFDGDINEIEVMGSDAALLPYSSDDWTGFMILFPFDGNVFILDAYAVGDRLSSGDEDELMEIVASIRATDGGGDDNNQTSGDTIETAADEDASGEDIVEELVELGLVEDGGDFLFEADELEEGSFEFVESYEGGRIVMGGWLSMEAGEDDEDLRFCTFVAQSTTDDPEDNEGTMFIAGLHSIDAVLFYEFDLEDPDNSVFEYFDHNTDMEDENHFLLIVQDDEASAYINGELVVEGWELDITAGDDERFTGFVVNEGCTMNNVWAYSFE